MPKKRTSQKLACTEPAGEAFGESPHREAEIQFQIGSEELASFVYQPAEIDSGGPKGTSGNQIHCLAPEVLNGPMELIKESHLRWNGPIRCTFEHLNLTFPQSFALTSPSLLAPVCLAALFHT